MYFTRLQQAIQAWQRINVSSVTFRAIIQQQLRQGSQESVAKTGIKRFIYSESNRTPILGLHLL
jgi:hypothetical protein